MAVIHVVAKYGFAFLVILSGAFLIEHLTSTKLTQVSEDHNVTDIEYNDQSQLVYESFESDLSNGYIKCLTNSSTPFCSLSSEMRQLLFQSNSSGNLTNEEIKRKYKIMSVNYAQPHAKQTYMLFKDFSNLMKLLNVRVFLLEPSVLFCLLSSAKRFRLMSRGFKLNSLQVSRDVVTFGVFRRDALILDQVNASEVISAGFTVSKFIKPAKALDRQFHETVHFFFHKEHMIVHVVVFYAKESYFWHSGLDVHDSKFCSLYLKEGSYENFTTRPLNLNGTSLSEFSIPKDPEYFLLQTMSSNFLECNKSFYYNVSTEEPSFFTKDELKKRILIALKELKAILLPKMIGISLWSKTLLGWYGHCDVLHYTSTLELSVPSIRFNSVHTQQLISSNEYLEFENETNSNTEFEYKLNCHGLSVHIIVLHEEINSFWYNRTIDNTTRRFTFPKFKLCSTDVYGLRINVPCDTNVYLL